MRAFFVCLLISDVWPTRRVIVLCLSGAKQRVPGFGLQSLQWKVVQLDQQILMLLFHVGQHCLQLPTTRRTTVAYEEIVGQIASVTYQVTTSINSPLLRPLLRTSTLEKTSSFETFSKTRYKCSCCLSIRSDRFQPSCESSSYLYSVATGSSASSSRLVPPRYSVPAISERLHPVSFQPLSSSHYRQAKPNRATTLSAIVGGSSP